MRMTLTIPDDTQVITLTVLRDSGLSSTGHQTIVQVRAEKAKDGAEIIIEARESGE